MPTNKRESLIFTIIMCFFMVLWMSVYNVARVHDWTFGLQIFADAWLGVQCQDVVYARKVTNRDGPRML